MSDRQSFILYHDQLPLLLMLSDKDAGRLIKELYRHSMGMEHTPLVPVAEMAYTSITVAMDRDISKYADIVQKRRESGRKGGRKRQANQANASFCQANQANSNPNPNPNSNSNSNSDSISYPIPSLQEVIDAGKALGVDEMTCIDYYDYNSDRDWIVNGERMKHWKIALKNWNRQIPIV